MEREQIIKALEWCIDEWDCEKCPVGDESSCHIETKALALIKELTEERKDFEIRALRAENQTLTYKDRYETAVADTVHKMQSLIKERCIKGGIYPAFVRKTIDQIAKEMLEG